MLRYDTAKDMGFPVHYNELGLDVIRQARKLLSNPERWCQGTSALDRKGEETTPLSDTACQWCLSAALDVAIITSDRFREVASYEVYNVRRFVEKFMQQFLVADSSQVLDEARKQGFSMSNIVEFNDGGKYENVIELLDKSIDRLQVVVS